VNALEREVGLENDCIWPLFDENECQGLRTFENEFQCLNTVRDAL
jgi:hypothetical protein